MDCDYCGKKNVINTLPDGTHLCEKCLNKWNKKKKSSPIGSAEWVRQQTQI